MDRASTTNLALSAKEFWEIRPRELTQQFLRGRMKAMKLIDQYEAACKVRRLASHTIQLTAGGSRSFCGFSVIAQARHLNVNLKVQLP